jgi:hypothetical protein
MKNLLAIIYSFAVIAVGCEKHEIESIIRCRQVKDVKTQIQTYNFEEGWNGFSTYLIAENMNAEVIFQQIADKITIVKTTQQEYPYAGVLWYTNQGVINTIGNINTDYGYLLHIKEPCTLTIEGESTTDTVIEIELEGWRMCGMPKSENDTIPSVYLFDNFGSMDVVKTIPDGKVYWPAMGIYQITHIEPGMACFVNRREEKKLLTGKEIHKIKTYDIYFGCYDKNGNSCYYQDASVITTKDGVEYK